MRVLGISGELEKIDKSERLFIPNTGEKNTRKEKKLADSKLFAFLNLKHKLKASVSLFCMQLKSQTLTISSRSYLPS